MPKTPPPARRTHHLNEERPTRLVLRGRKDDPMRHDLEFPGGRVSVIRDREDGYCVELLLNHDARIKGDFMLSRFGQLRELNLKRDSMDYAIAHPADVRIVQMLVGNYLEER